MINRSILFSWLLLLSVSLFAQWSSDSFENNPIALTAGEEAIPKVATSSEPSGLTYISWFSNESGNYNVRLQLLGLFGNPLWEEGGILISDHPAMTWLTDWDMTIDQEDHAILTFQDIRNGNNDVFAYRISPAGEFVWGDDGLELSTGPAFDASPKVCVTNNGDAIIAWQAEDVSLVQKISSTGELLWGDDGITISSAGNTISWPQVIAAGADDVIIKYFEDSGPVWAPTRKVYAQRYDLDGNPVWEEPATISDAGGISAWTQVFSIVNIGFDSGFYIAWHDDRDNDQDASVFVQQVDEDGQIQLGDDGTEASTQSNRENFYPFLALPDNSEDIFVFWNEMDADQNNRGIYGQKISSFGERLWSDNGKAFIEISSTNVFPVTANASTNGMIVIYENYSSVTDAGVSAMLIDEEGEFIWLDEMVELCSVQSEKVHSVANTFHFDQWIAVWEDNRNGNKDIYAQNIQLDGSLGALPSTPEITIIPDTLFIDENSMEYYVYVINTSYADYEIDSIVFDYEWVSIENLPEFPYTLAPNDTLDLLLPVYIIGSGGVGSGYEYETLFVYSSWETISSTVAFNLDVIPGIADRQDRFLQVYPNPGSQVFFDFSQPLENATLRILSATGQVIRQWDCSNLNTTSWDGKNDQGRMVETGTYLYQLITNDNIQHGKIILSR